MQRAPGGDDGSTVVFIADASITEGEARHVAISMTHAAGVTCQLAVTTSDGTQGPPSASPRVQDGGAPLHVDRLDATCAARGLVTQELD